VPGTLIVAVADAVEDDVTPALPAGIGFGPALEEVKRGAGIVYDQQVADYSPGLFEDGFVFDAN